MSIEINCKNQSIEDIMRDVKEKSESVIHGGWHVVIGKSNDPIMEFTNLDCLNEDEQYELLRNLDVMINQLQPIRNSYCGNNPIFTANIFTMRKIGVLNSLYQQVLCEIKKNKNEETDNKLVIINCKDKDIVEDKDIVDILKHILNALYGDISNSSPNIEFKNLVSLTIDDLKKLNKQLDGLYTTIRNSISPLTTADTSQKTWRLHRILDLQRQIIKETQRKENESRKLEEEYSKMSTEELKNKLKELEVVKDNYREWSLLYSDSRIYPTYKEDMEGVVKMCDDQIVAIETILNNRTLKDKIDRYNNLTIEELDTLYGSLIFILSFLSEDKYNKELKVIEKVLNMKRDE